MFRFSFGLGCLYRQNLLRLQISKAQKTTKKVITKAYGIARIFSAS
jgi:hypothetical protein